MKAWLLFGRNCEDCGGMDRFLLISERSKEIEEEFFYQFGYCASKGIVEIELNGEQVDTEFQGERI